MVAEASMRSSVGNMLTSASPPASTGPRDGRCRLPLGPGPAPRRSDRMQLSRFPRRRYTPHPTPLVPLRRLSAHLGGPTIWLKRDDELGLAGGGNKARKLEFLVADALERGADTLVTTGAVQSNHCRMTLAAARQEGLACRLVIEERVPGSYDEGASGNNLLFRLLDAERVAVVPAGADLAAALQAEVDDLAASGRVGYVIPGGGSNPLGALGYVAAAKELM